MVNNATTSIYSKDPADWISPRAENTCLTINRKITQGMHIRLSGTLQIEYLILIEGVWRIPDSEPGKPRFAVVNKY